MDEQLLLNRSIAPRLVPPPLLRQVTNHTFLPLYLHAMRRSSTWGSVASVPVQYRQV